MTEITGRPRPRPDNTTTPYWEAAARGELLYQLCPACGAAQHYPRALCTTCGADPEWRVSAGRGVVHSFTVIRQNGSPPFDRLVPYVVALVDLDEGPRLMTNVTDCAPESVRIGMPVDLHFIEEADGLHLPMFRPAPEVLP